MSENREIQLRQRNHILLGPRPRSQVITVESYAQRVDMPEVRKICRIIWNRRGVVTLVFLAVFLGVAIGTMYQKPIYRATGLLEIRQESADAAPVETLFSLGTISDDYMETQYGILKSETLAQRVIGELRLDETDEFTPRMPWWESKPTPATPGTILPEFQERLMVDPARGSRLVRVGFESQDPGLAAQVVNAMLSNYIELRIEEGQKASDWLSKQLDASKGKLQESEVNLNRYVKANGLQFLETRDGDAENLVHERIRQLQRELMEAQAARYEREAQLRLVNDGAAKGSLDHLENPVIQSLTVRLAELKRESAMLAATFRPDYPKSKQVRNQIEELEAQLQRERERTATRLQRDYSAAFRREALVREALEKQQQLGSGLDEKSTGYNTLKREVETNRQLYTALQQKLKEVGVSTALKATNVGIVDLAQPPTDPERPNTALNLTLGTILGLLLGFGLAFLQEHTDTRVKTVEEVDGLLGVPVLAMIPSLRSAKERIGAIRGKSEGAGPLRLGLGESSAALSRNRGWYRIDQGGQQSSALANAFAALRTAVLFQGSDSPPRSLLITSPQPGEGKTTISVNLAISLAKLGKRVLLVDADTRHSCIHQVFRVQNNQGLIGYLAGEREWKDMVQHDLVTGLDVLTAGSPHVDTTELLSSSNLRNMVSGALEEYDFVILDSPALFINLADARILSTTVEGVVLVLRSGSTRREVAIRALGQANNVMGVILNDLDINLLPSYYRDYYGAGAMSSESRPQVRRSDGPVVRPSRSRLYESWITGRRN